MKNYFKNLFNSSDFRHVQRLAMVCVCLSYAVVAVAWSEDYYSSIKVEISGEGSVYVTKPNANNSETLNSNGVVSYGDTESGRSGSAPESVTHSYSLNAEGTGNYYFYKLVDGNNDIINLPYSVNITTSYHTEETAKNAPNKTIQAIFKPYISIANEINFIVYDDGIDVVTFNIKDIYKRENLTLALKGPNADKFQLSKNNNDFNSSILLGSEEGLSATTTTNVSVYLNYSDGDYYDPEKALAVGDGTYLEIKDNKEHTWEVPIRTTAPESFTFLAGEGGKYTVVFANSENIIGLSTITLFFFL